MRDNRGITLIEMIVTMAVLGIVTAILASIIGMALKFYSSEHLDSSLQYEAQLALNSISNNVMQAKGIAILNTVQDYENLAGTVVNGANLTDQLCLGEFSVESGVYKYSGITIFGEYGTASSESMKLYIVEFEEEELTGGTIQEAMTSMQQIFDNYSADTKKAHLLAQNVETLLVEPTPGKIQTITDAGGNDIDIFSNPFSIDITIVFAGLSQKGVETQTIVDTIMIRNTLKEVYYSDYAELLTEE